VYVSKYFTDFGSHHFYDCDFCISILSINILILNDKMLLTTDKLDFLHVCHNASAALITNNLRYCKNPNFSCFLLFCDLDDFTKIKDREYSKSHAILMYYLIHQAKMQKLISQNNVIDRIVKIKYHQN